MSKSYYYHCAWCDKTEYLGKLDEWHLRVFNAQSSEEEAQTLLNRHLDYCADRMRAMRELHG